MSTCLVSPASADQYHYENMLIGDRASGMAGAYSAISDDTSGIYYNPAGTVYAEGGSVSGSMNTFHRTFTEYEDVLGSGGSWKRQSSAIVPNYFGFLQPLGGGVVGFSYAVTDSIQEDQDQLFRNIVVDTPGGSIDIDRYYINFNNQDNTYKIGPSYAARLTDEFSVGITLYGYFRSQELILNQQIYYANNATQWTNQYFEINETGYEPVLGLIWSPFNKFSFGMSVRKTMILSSFARTQTTVDDKPSDPSLGVRLNFPSVGTTTKPRDYPVNVRTGVAYFANTKLLVSGDVSYYTETDSRASITNFALGSEYYFAKNWASRFGVYSNYANTPTGGSLDHTDLYGLSLSGSRFTRNTSVTLGFNYSTGTGEAQVVAGTSNKQDMNMSTFTVFLSAMYSN